MKFLQHCLASNLFACCLVCNLLSIPNLHAESSLVPLQALPSRYTEPAAKQSGQQRWRTRIYGLRNAPLHPHIWGIRKTDQTFNVQMIPIRPFFLRASENESYRANKISMEFTFRPVREKHMLQFFHSKTPVLEIGFGGQYKKGYPKQPPAIDRSYSLRLSASPRLPSGVYFKSQGRYELLSENLDRIIPGEKYQLEIVFSSNSASFILNGKSIAQLEATNINRGLISIVDDWHPMNINNLEIKGQEKMDGLLVNRTDSGLVDTQLANVKAKR